MISRRSGCSVLKVITAACFMLTGLWLSAEEPFTSVNCDDILFLAHFNHSFVPDLAHGEGEPIIHLAAITGGGDGYPFGDSLPSAEALDLRNQSSWIAWPASGRFNLDEGTAQFWVKPLWQRKGHRSPFAMLFRLRFDEALDVPPWKNPAKAFFIAKNENRDEIRVSQGVGGIRGNIASWESQTWHQIAATWRGERLALYLDGQKAAEGKYRKPAAEPTEIVMGSPYSGHDAESVIDEVRILKRALNETEIRQDYLAQSFGRREFPHAATTDTAVAETFQPIVPETRKVETSLGKMDIRALYTKDTVTIDGKLDEAAWTTAPEVTGFRLRGKASAGAAEVQSFVKILYDDKNLYFGARFLEPRMEKLEAKFNQRDLNIYDDDCLELVFDTRGKPGTFYHFCANLIGGIYDSRNGDKSWSSYNSSCLGERGKDEWTLELAIPFADLEISRPTIGEVWGLRLCRERQPVTESSSLPFTAAAFSARQDLARLIFEGAAGVVPAFYADTQAEGFDWGLNRIAVRLSNPGDTLTTAHVSASLFERNNLLLGVFEAQADIPVKGEAEVILEVPVTTDAAERLSVVANDASGAAVWGRALTSLFEPSEPLLSEIEAALPAMNGDANYIAANRSLVAQGVLNSVARLEEAIAAFHAKVAAAIKAGITLAPAEWDLTRGFLAGFDAWRQQHEMRVWEVDPWSNGTPRDLPPSVAASTELCFFQAGNERECRALALHGLLVAGRADVRLAVSHLKRNGDPKSWFSPNHVHIYRAPYMRDGFGRLITDPLLECSGNIITLSPGWTEKVWVVLDSRGLEPGEYEGTITVKPLDTSVGCRQEWISFPLKATVWDFTLPETRDWPLDTFLFGPGLSPLNEIEAARLLHDYHINWVMSNRFQYDVGLTENGKLGVGKPKGLSFRPELISAQDDFLREAKRLGLKVMFAWNSCRDPEWYKQMIPHLLSLGFSYDEFAFQGLSDEFRVKSLENHMPFHRKMYEQDKNINFMATFTSVPPPEGVTLDQIEEAAKYVKIWIHHRPRVWPPEAERTQENLTWFRARDRVVWSYTCSTQMQNWPILDYYRFSPWRGFLTGLDGICYWTLLSSSGDDGFDHGDGYDEGMTFRGLNNMPVPTKRLEALREGLEDVAYMHILRTRLSVAKVKEPSRDFSAQEKLLTEIPLAIEKSKNTLKIESWRENTARAILALPALP